MVTDKVVVTHAVAFDDEGEITIRGYITADSLRCLQKPKYQREVLAGSKNFQDLIDAIKKGPVPDIVLNMRGSRYKQVGTDSFELHDATFLVDGLQRTSAAIRAMDEIGDSFDPRIAAVISIDKDEAWELMMFETLNNKRTQLSPNVNLRNQRTIIAAIRTLYRLSANTEFALYRRVTWEQTSKKDETITATVYVKSVGRLHGNFGPGKGSNVYEVAKGVDSIMNEIGSKVLSDNVMEFFDAIVGIWGESAVNSKRSAVLKQGFLFTFARFIADHPMFWSGERLTITQTHRNKLAKLDVTGELLKGATVSVNGSGADILYEMFRNYISSGLHGGVKALKSWSDVEGGA